VIVEGNELLKLPGVQMRRLRGVLVSYVPQNPAAALNPAYRIGDQIGEILFVHRKSRRRTQDLLKSVGLPTSREFLRRFPHQLSGGQQQRVAIAMAIAPEPRLIVMDEPTTGLDATTQRQILELASDIRIQTGASFLYVTHDLSVVAQI